MSTTEHRSVRRAVPLFALALLTACTPSDPRTDASNVTVVAVTR